MTVAQDQSSTAARGATWLNGDAWPDGETPPASAMVLHDRGFVLGDGLFETLAMRDGKPVLWRPHIDRMVATGAVVHFPVPADIDETAAAAVRVLLPMVDPGIARCGTLRITVTRGSGTAYGLDAGATPELTVLVRLMPSHRRQRTLETRETAWIVDQPRIDPGSLLSGHKTTSSMWRVLAHETARQQGADLALLMTTEGDIGEADTASVFAVIGGVVVTPPLSRGILPSTTRAFALAALDAAGKPYEERQIQPAELDTASEIFISSSVNGVRPLGAVNGRRLPDAAPVCDWLHERYEALGGGFSA